MRLYEIDPSNKVTLKLSGNDQILKIGISAFQMRMLHSQIILGNIDKLHWTKYLQDFTDKSEQALEILNQLPVQTDPFITNLKSKIETDLDEIKNLKI